MTVQKIVTSAFAVVLIGSSAGHPLRIAAATPTVAVGASLTESKPPKRFRIAFGVTNLEYRKQALALTPLGTPYEQVRAFAEQERRARKGTRDNIFNPGLVRYHHSQQYLDLITSLCRRDECLGCSLTGPEPPLAPVRLSKKNGYIEGTGAFAVFLCEKPSPISPVLVICARYIFDARNRLIDLYCLRSRIHKDLPFALPPAI